MCEALANGAPVVTLSGAAGCGKTLLIRCLRDALGGSAEFVALANPGQTQEQSLATVALALGLAVPAHASPAHLQRLLCARISERCRNRRHVIILLDEVERVRSQAIGHILALCNRANAEGSRVQLLLVGRPGSHSRVAGLPRELRRAAPGQAFHLPGPTAQEVRAYLRLRLQAAGYAGPELFTRSASRLLALSARGSLRSIDLLAERALAAAAARNASTVRWQHVWQARTARPRGPSPFSRMSAGLVSGVLAGAGLAFAASPLFTRSPAGDAPVESQEFDEKRPVNALTAVSPARPVSGAATLLAATTDLAVTRDAAGGRRQ